MSYVAGRPANRSRVEEVLGCRYRLQQIRLRELQGLLSMAGYGAIVAGRIGFFKDSGSPGNALCGYALWWLVAVG